MQEKEVQLLVELMNMGDATLSYTAFPDAAVIDWAHSKSAEEKLTPILMVFLLEYEPMMQAFLSKRTSGRHFFRYRRIELWILKTNGSWYQMNTGTEGWDKILDRTMRIETVGLVGLDRSRYKS